jgi:hypothetical protein
MMLWCQHRVEWYLPCTPCLEDDIAEEMSTIDDLVETYAELHSAMDACVAEGLMEPRPREKDAIELGYKLWSDHARSWWKRHGDRYCDLGGEA